MLSLSTDESCIDTLVLVVLNATIPFDQLAHTTCHHVNDFSAVILLQVALYQQLASQQGQARIINMSERCILYCDVTSLTKLMKDEHIIVMVYMNDEACWTQSSLLVQGYLNEETGLIHQLRTLGSLRLWLEFSIPQSSCLFRNTNVCIFAAHVLCGWYRVATSEYIIYYHYHKDFGTWGSIHETWPRQSLET